MECPFCKNKLNEGATACPCGGYLGEKLRPWVKNLCVFLSLLLILPLTLTFLFLLLGHMYGWAAIDAIGLVCTVGAMVWSVKTGTEPVWLHF